MEDQGEPKQIKLQIKIRDDMASGRYSNLALVHHNDSEFVLDFLFVQPQRTPQGQSVANLRSRVVTTPEHMKRILKAIEENIGRYEQSFGPISAATDMPKVVH